MSATKERSGVQLPVPSDAQRLAARLATEERRLVERLAELESRARRFSDVERPAYETWRRLELGPLLPTLQEASDELRMRTVLAERLRALVEQQGLSPREALDRLTRPEASRARRDGGGFDPDEVEARRRAKREAKRARRKETKRAARATARSAEPCAPEPAARTSGARADRVVRLYRALARRIHPDSPTALKTLAPDRLGALWTDVQEAYAARSLERLLAVSAWVEALGAAGEDVAPAEPRERRPLVSLSERYARLRALRRSCRALERRIAELALDPAWSFTDKRAAERRKLARRARAEVEQEIARVRCDLDELDAVLGAMGAPRRARAHTPR